MGRFDCGSLPHWKTSDEGRIFARWGRDGNSWESSSEGRKACLAIECIVAVPDLEEAKAIASKKLIGVDEITATKLSRAKIKALNLKEGDVRL